MSSTRMAVVCGLLAVLVVLAACGPAPEMVVVPETTVSAETHIAAGTVVVTEVAMVAAEPEPSEPPNPEPSEPAPSETAPDPAAERMGLWRAAGEPETLDYHAAFDSRGLRVVSQCVEGLFEYRGDGSIEPVGATGLDVSDDGRVYTIKLREGVSWSDGQPVVARHYVDSIIRQLEQELEAWEIYDIAGAQAYQNGEAGDPATVGVRAVDDHTLEIRLVEPAPHFAAILPSYRFYPVRLDLIETHGDRWTEPGNYLCNGAYLLDDWIHGDRVVLVKNPGYWNADQVSVERITFANVLDPLASYKNDELHLMTVWDLEAESILGDPALSQELHLVPQPGLNYMGLNTQRPPTDDVKVRKALAQAIDHESFVAEMAWSPEWTPAACTIPPKVLGHQPYGTCGHTYNPEGARTLLAEAGYPNGEELPPVHLWTFFQTWAEDATRMVAAMWEETLGITTEVHVLEWETYIEYLTECARNREALAACELNNYLIGWVMDFGDPQNILETVFAPGSTLHHTGWENEHYTELLELASTEYDPARRAEYYREADKILVEDQAVIIPLLYKLRPMLIKQGMTYEYPPFGPVRYKHWSLP